MMNAVSPVKYAMLPFRQGKNIWKKQDKFNEA